MQTIQLWQGDCLDRLKEIESSTVEAVISDPPYGISFHGSSWDSPDNVAFRPELWKEVQRILKPRGIVRAMGATRTFHRLVRALVEAGLSIGPLEGWCHSEGLPKFANVEKEVRKIAGDVEAEFWSDWRCHLAPAWEPIVFARKGPPKGEHKLSVAILARKPLSEKNIASNVLKWSTGGLNIGATRILPDYRDPGELVPDSGEEQDKGRWTKNLILAHRPECTATECEESCPVLDLDQQGKRLGIHSAGAKRQRTVNSPYCASSYHICPTGRRMDRFGDFHGASGFFKKIPTSEQLLLDYLSSLIVPEYGTCVVSWKAESVDWGSYGSNSLHGVVAQGPVGDIAGQAFKALRPGGHYIFLASKSDPTGYAAAIALEEVGFEIRDSILLAFEGGALHYVPKVSSSRERSAGVEGENKHPTMKPIRLMRALLRDVSEGLVVDPFSGTGTLGIACLSSGHDHVGIELDPDYVRVAGQRIRFWDREVEGSWSREVEILSELDEESDPEEELGLEDLFGGE